MESDKVVRFVLGQVPVCIRLDYRKEDIRLHGKGNSKLPWCKAGQPRDLVDVVDSDRYVVNKELSLSMP